MSHSKKPNKKISLNMHRMAMVAVLFYTLTLFSNNFLYAETQSAGPINVNAEIPSGLTLEMVIIDQRNNAQVPSMDFDELTRVSNEFRASTFFKVYLSVNVAGDAYELTQTATPLTHESGSDLMPPGAFIVKPEYLPGDNNGVAQPIGSTLGTQGTAVGSRELFRDPSGASSVLTCTYTLSGDPNTGATEPISLSQKSGAYFGTVQFTLTTT